ncbi:MAG TPA: hypothetical protein VGO59_16955 [Verrucomicrobiae bacterium]
MIQIDDGGGPADNDSLVTVQVDGVSEVSMGGSSTAVNLSQCYIGTRAYPAGFVSSSNHDLVGQLAAVLAYDRQLSGSEVNQAVTYLANFFGAASVPIRGELSILLTPANSVVVS